MNVAILSDSHDYYENLEKAIGIANERNCEYLLHAGDFIAPGAFSTTLTKFNGKIILTFGNNDNNPMLGVKLTQNLGDRLESLGFAYDGELNGKKIFMNHYPLVGQNMASSDKFDIVIYGDDHQYHMSKVGNTTLLNPGTLNPKNVDFCSFVIWDTVTNEFELIKF